MKLIFFFLKKKKTNVFLFRRKYKSIHSLTNIWKRNNNLKKKERSRQKILTVSTALICSGTTPQPNPNAPRYFPIYHSNRDFTCFHHSHLSTLSLSASEMAGDLSLSLSLSTDPHPPVSRHRRPSLKLRLTGGFYCVGKKNFQNLQVWRIRMMLARACGSLLTRVRDGASSFSSATLHFGSLSASGSSSPTGSTRSMQFSTIFHFLQSSLALYTELMQTQITPDYLLLRSLTELHWVGVPSPGIDFGRSFILDTNVVCWQGKFVLPTRISS